MSLIPPREASLRPLEVVGIAASAADFGALEAFFEGLPDRSGLAVVVALDSSDRTAHELAEILGPSTRFPVVPVTGGSTLEPDRVYLIPSGGAVFSGDRLDFLKHPPADRDGPPRDLLFRTLAETHRGAAAGIVLSRPASDGVLGLGRIRELGGITLAQAPDEAKHAEATREAIRDGSVDRVLPVAQLGPELLRLIRERSSARDGSDEAKTNFLAVVSHEFRTPLSSIVGYTALLAEGISGDLTERQHDHVARIREAARQLEEMVDEILSYSDAQIPGRGPRPADIDPGGLALTVVELATSTARKKGLEIRIELHDELPVLKVDPMKLRQILLHLLGNAVKFTDVGHVLLRVRARGPDVLFEVEDTGVGIRPEDLEHVFEPFWQEDMSRTRTHGGIGLGLSVVEDLAHLLGGSVAVESAPGQGTRFQVSLPRNSSPLHSEVPGEGPTAG